METGLEKIGQGAFSKVYLNSRKVLIKSVDNVKECMASIWFPESSLFPETKSLGCSESGEFNYYEQKFYPKVKSLKNNLIKSDYEFYRILRDLQEQSVTDNPYDGYNRLYQLFSTIPGKYHVKRSQLLEALDALSNYGSDIGFEISPRNVAVENKRLIMLDCFFMTSQLKEIRSNKR